MSLPAPVPPGFSARSDGQSADADPAAESSSGAPFPETPDAQAAADKSGGGENRDARALAADQRVTGERSP